MKNLPKKIYLSFGEMPEDRFEKEDYKEFCEYHNNLVAFNEHKMWETDVEYIRKDVFIKNISLLWKVEEFLIDNLKELPIGNGKFKVKTECSLEELIEKLENYVRENHGEELIDSFHKAMEE